MSEKLPSFIFGAIYRTKSGLKDASATAARFNCYTPASPVWPCSNATPSAPTSRT